jgi:hypothetical protein
MTEELEQTLAAERPVPDASWRGALGRRLGSAWAPPPRPDGLAARIGGLAAAGAALLLVALTQL